MGIEIKVETEKEIKIVISDSKEYTQNKIEKKQQEFSPEYKVVGKYCGLLNARACKCVS